MSAWNPGIWAEPLLALAVGGAVVTAVAMLATRRMQTGATQRVVWQSAFAGLALIFVAELTGLPGIIRDRFADEDDAIIKRAKWAAVPHSSPAVVRPSQTTPAVTDPREDEEMLADTEPAVSEATEAVWWPGVLWLTGAMLVAGRVCGAHILLSLFRFRHRRSSDSALIALTAEVAARMGYRRTVDVVEAGRLISPAAFGIVRPTLALPAGFSTEFTRTQQEAMLAHELAHLAAHDPAWHFFAQLTTAVFWWHPLVWWAQAEFRAAGERAADEASLVVADGPGVLASCLVQLGSRLVRRPFGWLSMAGGGFRSGLGRRVERLLCLERWKGRPPSKWRLRAILILGPVLLVAASALSTAWAWSPADNEGDEPMNSAWKRSVAATVIVAALGSADLPGGQQPERAKTSGETSQHKKPPSAQLEGALKLDDPREFQGVAAKLGEELNAVAAQREELKKKIESKDDKGIDALKAQLEELEKKQLDLKNARFKLEEQIRAAAEAKPKLEKQPARIKVFRLKHRDPNEVSSVLTDLLPQPEPGKGGGGGMMGTMQGMMGQGGGMIGGGAAGGMMGTGGTAGGQPMGLGMGGGMGALGFGGGAAGFGGFGGLGGFGGGGRATGAAVGASWRITVDERTNSVVVRGNESDLRTIGDIVTALDSTDTKASLKLKNLRTFKLKYADVNQVSQIVQDLELHVKVSILPSAEMLVVSGGESALKEVADLIAELDVEAKVVPLDDKPKPIKDTKKPKQ